MQKHDARIRSIIFPIILHSVQKHGTERRTQKTIVPCLGRGLVPADKSVLSWEVLQFGQLGAQTLTPLITLVGQQNSGDCSPVVQGDLTGSGIFWKSFSLEENTVNYFDYMFIQSFNLPKVTCRKHSKTSQHNSIYCLAVTCTETSSWLVIKNNIFWVMWWVMDEAEVDEREVEGALDKN